MKPIALLTIAMVLSFAGCERDVSKYPYATIADVPPPNDTAEWQHVQTLGDPVGPFRGLGGQQLNTGAQRKRVGYMEAGILVEKDLYFPGELLLDRYENRKGDSFVIVYQRRPKPKPPSR